MSELKKGYIFFYDKIEKKHADAYVFRIKEKIFIRISKRYILKLDEEERMAVVPKHIYEEHFV